MVINRIEDHHTFISDTEANVGVTLVSGEDQVQEVGGADEELRDLCTLITPNQRGRRIASIPYLENVIVNLSPESVDENSAMHQHGSFTTKWDYMDSSQSCLLVFLQDITYLRLEQRYYIIQTENSALSKAMCVVWVSCSSSPLKPSCFLYSQTDGKHQLSHQPHLSKKSKQLRVDAFILNTHKQ